MSRRVLIIVGALILGGLWLGPLPAAAQHAFFAHMTMHMGVVAIAAPLISAGVAGGVVDPVRRWPRLFRPVPASLCELVVVWTWHAPALHHFARSGAAGLILEQASFLLAGLFVWLSAFGGGSGRHESRAPSGVIGLLLTAMHMTLLGALLALATRPLYHVGVGIFGLTALEDQHLGGAIMLLVGGISYLSGGLYLTAGLLRHSDVAPEEFP